MTPTDCIRDGCIPAVTVAARETEHLRARLALMNALEASLHRSRKALLALDLAGVERGTIEQTGLIRECGEILWSEVPIDLSAGTNKLEGQQKELLKKELGLCQQRILEAGRLQAALLARAQSKLRVLANMLAGPSVIYSPPVVHDGAQLHSFDWKQRSAAQRSDTCRA